MYKELIDFLVDKRMDMLAQQEKISSEETLNNKLLECLTKSGRELMSDEKAELMLFIDRVQSDKDLVYRQGVIDGIRLMHRVSSIAQV